MVISHGLWDDPESFEGWGEVLLQPGTVLLPDHPGSDFNQQQSMLAGDHRPGPEELRLRPLDVTALLDAIDQGQLLAVNR